ncbi:MAG: hypothetical protein KatS3mg113_0509 [Planctomycetaceae bacterium]|nr:MAG: hypothetical protein KatS3mg113_0509 [Planctomycetaceae bacterium]
MTQTLPGRQLMTLMRPVNLPSDLFLINSLDR